MNTPDRIKYLEEKHKELHALVEKLQSQPDAPREESDLIIKEIKKTKLIIKDEMEKLRRKIK